MEKETYKSKGGRTLYRPVVSEDEMSGADNVGFCLGCGSEASGVEPDARKYKCESCDESLVYGLEELLIMGLLKIAA